ncbi:MAG TPA: NRDE family protein [Pseudomonadales bacterium]|nr:NRDE family protein [Pseudomonadales bacterium]
MCLILFAWHCHPQYPLLVAANRDEFHARPTAPVHFWRDYPHILAGRDLQEGGSWLGISTTGRFAALTNVRDPHAIKGALSRGCLVRDFLDSTQSPEAFHRQLQQQLQLQPHAYSPFNLLMSDSKHFFYTNHRGDLQKMSPGIYALSNAGIDTPWPKAIQGKQALADALTRPLDFQQNQEKIFALLADKKIAADHELPDTGIGLTLERMLSARFILSEEYGTRSSTLLSQSNASEIRFIERQFGAAGQIIDTLHYAIDTGKHQHG